MTRFAETSAQMKRHARLAGWALLACAGLQGQAQAAEDCGVPVPAAGGASKAAAILGGAQSRLALINAQQASAAAPLSAPQPEPVAATVRSVSWQVADSPRINALALFAPMTGAGSPFLPGGLQSAAFHVAVSQPVQLPKTQPDCALRTTRAVMSTGNLPGFAPRGDSPDVFGSVAMAVSRTPLDGNWRKVRGGGVGAGPWSAMLNAARTQDRAGQLRLINNWVNARIAFVDDSREYGMADHWATPAQSLGRGRGDCEDYAIAKLGLLRSIGIPASDLYLVIARDLVRRADHAVLAVRLGGRLVILDNETDRIFDAEDIRDYRPVMSYAGDRSWTHGYRARPDAMTAPLRTASVGTTALR